MKKLLSILLVGVLSLGIMAGCSPKVEEKAKELASAADVAMYMSLISKGDLAGASTLAHNEVNYDKAILLDETVDQQAYMALVYPLITCKTNTETVVENEVTVNSDITAPNMGAILESIIKMAEAEPSLEGFTKEQIAAINMENFQQALDAQKENLVTTNLDIKIKMVDGVPLIVMDDAFMAALMGGSTEVKLGFEKNPA